MSCHSQTPRASTARPARVVGRGVLSGAGRGVAAFWQAMLEAAPLQQERDIGDPRLQSPRYVSVPTERDPEGSLASHWLQIACADALAEAEPLLPPPGPDGPARVALMTGSSLGGMTELEATHRRWWGQQDGASGPGLPLHEGLYQGPACWVGTRLKAVTAGSWTVNTACSSAANALGLARAWLSRGRIDAALVAGYDVISPFVYAGFCCLGAVDPAPATPFGKQRRGLNLGEAAVAMVLLRAEDAADAPRPIDIVGYGSSCDAHHLTRPDLGGAGLARAIRAALGDAEASPEQVGLLSAHGTGTPYNDRMEAAAFASVFGAHRPPMHCAKPVLGHTLGAAGAADALLVCEALRRGLVPPTYLRGEEDDELPVHPCRQALPLSPEAHALSTSSGFGGSNAALVLRRGDGAAAAAGDRP